MTWSPGGWPRRLAALAMLGACSLATAGELGDALRSSYGAFLQGRYEDAASGFRYLETLGLEDSGPSANLALLARDQARPDEAAAHWLKATRLSPNDGFLWAQRGWCYFSMGRAREAREAFKKAVEVSTSAAWTAEANLGLGLVEAADGNSKEAAQAYQAVFVRSPYLNPLAAAELGRLARRMKRLMPAQEYLAQSLRRDELQPEVARELAAVFSKAGQPKAAWLAYKAVLDIVPGDRQAAEGMERTQGYVDEKPERLLQVRRLAGPMLSEFPPAPASPLVRVSIMADPAGMPAHVQKLFFVSGSDFRIADRNGSEQNRGLAGEQWEVVYNPESGVVDFRGMRGEIQAQARQPFRIEPSTRATVVLKSAELETAELVGRDVGDRELRGVVEVIPTPKGFHLVNELTVEEYLFGIVGAAMPRGARDYAVREDALMAQAVVSRSKAEAARRRQQNELLRADLCDSPHCEAYAGLAQEREESTLAVRYTMGERLHRGEDPFEPPQHRACGGWTEEGVADFPEGAAPAVGSPAQFEAWLHGPPSPAQFCEATPLVQSSSERWMRLLAAADLRSRIEGDRIGRIEGLRVLRRTPYGRVQALEAAGPKGKAVFEGEDAVLGFLSPGGMPSALFTLQPLYRGRAVERVLLWGAGRGRGRGFCTAGALGLAELGRDYKAILKHYFPGAEVRGRSPDAAARPVKPKPPPPPRERAVPRTPAGRQVDPGARRALREKLRRKARERPGAAPGGRK